MTLRQLGLQNFCSNPTASALAEAAPFELEGKPEPQPEAVVRHLAPDLLARFWVARKIEIKKSQRQPACLHELFAQRTEQEQEESSR